MSMIPHGFFPRSAMNMDQWNRPVGGTSQALATFDDINKTFVDTWNKQLNTLDMFDAFDPLDHTIGRNMQWLNRPEFMQPALPKVPQKYRITLDCVGYSPADIKTEFKDGKLTVWGCQSTKCDETGDFHNKEFKKTYTMPVNAECDKMVSFMTGDRQLCIEVPLKETELHQNFDLFPQICDAENGGKCMKMKFTVPENIAPEHIHINIKDRCLVVKAEEKKVKPDGVSTFHYYKKTTLPENTEWDELKCSYDNHQISVCAPLNLNWTPTKKITFGENGKAHHHGHHAAIHDVDKTKCPFAGKHGETAWPGKTAAI